MRKRGDMIFATARQSPAFCRTFIAPHQSPIIPARAMESVTAFDAPSSTATASSFTRPSITAKKSDIEHIMANILEIMCIMSFM